jgi:hypothetical protein
LEKLCAFFVSMPARWRGRSAAERAVSIAMGLCIALGLFLRARGFLFETIPLWNDEAAWAIRTITLPLTEHVIRPIGFMALTKLAVVSFGPTETALRLVPWCAGVLSTLALPWIARRLYQSAAARVLFVAVIALHPAAIDLSKEFKPYSSSLALHLVLLALVLSYVETGRLLVPVLVTAALGCIFAQDLVFAYPALFLVAGVEAYRRRKSKELVAIAACAALIIALLVTQYFLFWRQLPRDESDYWAEKYNVFNTAGRSYVRWWVSSYLRMVDMPGLRRDDWADDWVSRGVRHVLLKGDHAIWILLHLAGLVVIGVRKQWRQAVLLVSPLVAMTLFNALGFWPLGAFRTNLFVLAYIVAIAAKALDVRRRRTGQVHDGVTKRSVPSVLATVPAFLLVVLPLLCFEREWHADKRVFTFSSEFPYVLRKLMRLHRQFAKEREPLLIDSKACVLWRYYVEYHPTVSGLRPKLRRRFDAHCADADYDLRAGILAAGAGGRQNWLVAHNRIRVQPPIQELLGEERHDGFEIVFRDKIGVHAVLVFRGTSGHIEPKARGARRERASKKRVVEDD